MNKLLPFRPFLFLTFILLFLFSLEEPLSFASGDPYIKEYSNSGCLTSANGDSSNDFEEYPGCEDEGISAKVEGNSIFITHYDATYNCCPDDIRVTLFKRGNRLLLREKEILTIPCDCLCCYNVETEIAGVESGTYIVFVCWKDYEEYKMLCRRVTVVVP